MKNAKTNRHWPFKKAQHGVCPAIVMCVPRDPFNVGAAVRAASCFGITQLWVSGFRCAQKVWEAKRIPREERMKGFADVDIKYANSPGWTTGSRVQFTPSLYSRMLLQQISRLNIGPRLRSTQSVRMIRKRLPALWDADRRFGCRRLATTLSVVAAVYCQFRMRTT